MITGNCLKKLFFTFAVISLALGIVSGEVFARDRHHGGHEYYSHGGKRYHYYDGRWYTSGLFWLGLSFVMPPIGATVSYLPYGYRTIYLGRVPYYEYGNVYYRPYGTRYIVVERPVAVSPDVVYAPAVGSLAPEQAQTGERETVVINVPQNSGGYVAITLVRYPNGFVGPQGEFYPNLPTGEQLRARYGR